MNTILLETKNLTIGYDGGRSGQRPVVESIAVSLRRGELVCLLGPNGAGKSTLMRTLAGMQTPLAGRVWLNGWNVHQMDARARARLLSLVLTERLDVGMLSAYALVALGRHPYTSWTGKLSAADEAVIQTALTAVSAQDLAHRAVQTLSDGERQKVMIARALAQEPQLILLDEPTAFLDLPRRVEIMQILRQLAHDQNRAVLLSTHDLDLALRHADKIWLLPQHGPLQVGTPEDLVLSGAFAQAFASEGIAFDAMTGSFEAKQHSAGDVDLIGAGLPAIWVSRALTREGFHVNMGRNGAPVKVSVMEEGHMGKENGRFQWQLVLNNSTEQHHSVQSLLQSLRQYQATRTQASE